MKNIFSKTNAPYLASGALAIGTLLTSGIFAVAPYIGFLAPVAALSLGLPFVIGGIVFSAAAIALSAVVIGKNNTISKKDAQLTEKVKEIEDKNSQVVLQEEIILKHTKEVNTKEKEISKLEAQLVERNKELKDKDTVISYLDAQSVKKEAEMQAQQQENSELKGQVTNLGQTIASQAERINEKDQDVRRMQCELAATKRSSEKQRSAKNIGVQAQECKDSDVQSAKSACNWIPSLKTVGLVAGGAGLLVVGGVLAANGGFGAAGNPSNAVVNPVNSIGSHTSIVNSLSTFHRPVDQQIMQIQIDEAAEKLADAEKWYEDKSMPAEDNTSHKNVSQGMINRIFSVPCNLWSGVSNLFGGANNSAAHSSEPKWYQDLDKEDSSANYTYSNGTIGANYPSQNCRVTRSSGKHTAGNETLTPCSTNEYKVGTGLNDLNLCCALPEVSINS
jgi:hypothetical protein